MTTAIRIECNIGQLLVSRKGHWLRLVVTDNAGKSVAYLTKADVAKLVEAANALGPERELGEPGQ